MNDAPEVHGDFSLSLDKLRIPIGVPKDVAVKQMKLEGKLVLDQMSMAVNSPLGQSLVHLVADMNRMDVSNAVRFAHHDEIRFQVRDGRLYHEGLRIGFPDIDPKLQITSHGSVGLDKTLDLTVELPRLDEALRQKKGPAKCHITGTMANPIFSVEDASLVLRQHDRNEPILATDGINLNARVETTASGRVLVFEPVEVFKGTKLNLGVAAGLVKFLAPDVQEDRQVTGDLSLSFTKLRVPLGVSKDQAVKQLDAEGKLTLHQVSSEVKGPMWQAMIRLLADMNGKLPPKVIRLTADAEIPFQVRDGRLHHGDLRVGFPDIDPELVIRSHGSIGMDETLDLFVELPRLDKAQRKEKKPA
jgi:hypothetical protein